MYYTGQNVTFTEPATIHGAHTATIAALIEPADFTRAAIATAETIVGDKIDFVALLDYTDHRGQQLTAAVLHLRDNDEWRDICGDPIRLDPA